MSETENKLSPNEVFAGMKSDVTEFDPNTLDDKLKVTYDNLNRAQQLGQERYTAELAFNARCMVNQRTAAMVGFDKCLSFDSLREWLAKVDEKRHIRLIELEKYSRTIPEKNAEDIQRAKNLNVFDQFHVIYTDLTDYKKTDDPEYVSKNRDPIVIGLFYNRDLNFKYDMVTVITDWEDEYCDLTLSKMIEKMAEDGYTNVVKDVDFSDEALTGILTDFENKVKSNSGRRVEEVRPKWYSKFWSLFSKKK